MKKRLLALLLAIVIVVGLVVVAIPASAEEAVASESAEQLVATKDNYLVGYAKLDVNPWILYPDGKAPEGVSNMTDDQGKPIGVSYEDSWAAWDDGANGATYAGRIKTTIVDTADGEKTVGIISTYLAGSGTATDSYAYNLLDDNADGKVGYGDGLQVTATAVTDYTGKTAIFVTVDAIAGADTLRTSIRNNFNTAFKDLGITIDDVYINGSHSHNTPDLYKLAAAQNAAGDNHSAVGQYWRYYKNQVLEVCKQAVAARTLATMSKGSIDASVSGHQLNFVRHYTTNSGAIGGSNFGPNDYTDHLYDADDTMHLLQFTPTNSGKSIVLINWRAHGTFIGNAAATSYSSDFIGPLRAYLEKENYHVAFLQGAAGNAVPESAIESKNTWKTENTSGFAALNYDNDLADMRDAAHYGYLLSQVAQQGLLGENMETLNAGPIRTVKEEFVYEIQTFTDEEKAAAEAWHNAGRPSSWPYQGELNSYFHAEAVYNSVHNPETDTNIDVSAIMLGDKVAMVTCGNELFDRYNAEDNVGSIDETKNDWDKLEGEGTYGTPFVLAYTNGEGHKYMPNTLAYSYNEDSNTYGTGCYESNTSKFAAGTGEALIEEYDAMLQKLNKEAECKHCGRQVTWYPLTDAEYKRMITNESPWSGHYYLAEDVGYNGIKTISLNKGDALCLDLNSYTVERQGRFAKVAKAAELSIMDSSEGKTGTIISKPYEANILYGGVAEITGTLNLYSGTLKCENEFPTDVDTTDWSYIGRGGVLDLDAETAVFNMYGGSVVGCALQNTENVMVNRGCGRAIYSMGTLNLSGGTITSGVDDDTTNCIYLSTNGRVVLSGNANVDTIRCANFNSAKLEISGIYTGKVVFEGVQIGDIVATCSDKGEEISNVDGATIICTGVANAKLVKYGENQLMLAQNDSVVITNGASYSDVATAMNNVDPGSRLIFVADATISEELNVEKSVTVDFNGRTITFEGEGMFRVADGYTLYCMDAATADYTVEDGVYTQIPVAKVAGNIAGVPCDSNYVDCGIQYIKVNVEGSYSFHCVKLDTYAITVQANNGKVEDPGIYYTSDFAGDEVVAEKVTEYGVALSILGEPTAENFETQCVATALTTQKEFEAGADANTGTGTLLYNILNTNNVELVNRRNANTKVYGKAYMVIEDANGKATEYLFGNATDNTADQTKGYSLKDAFEAANDSWNGYDNAQKDSVVNMLFNYNSIVKSWDIPNVRSHKVDDKSLNILLIGNSHGLDSTRMLYEVFQKEGYEEDLIIANLYYGGCTMQQHADFLTNNKAVYEYHKVSSEGDKAGKWTRQKDVTGLTAMKDEQWDIVILQQANRWSGLADKFNTKQLDAVMNFVKANQLSTPEFAWNMLWANPDDYEKFLNDNAQYAIHYITKDANDTVNFRVYGETNFGDDEGRYQQENLYQKITENVNSYRDYIDTDKVCPAGTAILKAQELLKEEGLTDQAAQLRVYRDYTHLSHYGRLIAAYTWYGTLVGKTEFKAEDIITEIPGHLNNNEYDDHNSTYNTSNSYPELNNNVYTFTEEDIAVLVEAVNWALANNPANAN